MVKNDQAGRWKGEYVKNPLEGRKWKWNVDHLGITLRPFSRIPEIFPPRDFQLL